MGRKAENLVGGLLGVQKHEQVYEQKQEQECEAIHKFEQEHRATHETKHEYEHTPLKRDRELKTKRMNLLLPPSLAAWFKETAYAQGLSLNDAAIEAFREWGAKRGCVSYTGREKL